MKRSPLYTVLALAVLFLAVVPLGTSVFVLGFFLGDSPCILCWAQRIGMALVALIGLFVLRYGPKPKYLGLGVLVGAWGVFMAIRHSSLHLARDVGQGFALEMLGAHTYIWSFAVFWVCIVVMAAMLMKVPAEDLQPAAPRALRGIDRVALAGFLLVIAGTIVQAFASTGPPPFVGQSDPVRFSFDPRHWVWSLDEFSSAPVSVRGRWAIAKPDVTAVDPDPATAPLHSVPQLTIAGRRSLNLGLNGAHTDLAYDAASNRYLLTTEHGVYLTDGALQNVVRHTVIDPLFSVDMGRFAGAALLGNDRIIAVTENKSYLVLRETGKADVDLNYRYFLESPEAFEEVSRARFATLRAKMMYVMSAAARRPRVALDRDPHGAEREEPQHGGLPVRHGGHDAVGGIRPEAVRAARDRSAGRVESARRLLRDGRDHRKRPSLCPQRGTQHAVRHRPRVAIGRRRLHDPRPRPAGRARPEGRPVRHCQPRRDARERGRAGSGRRTPVITGAVAGLPAH